MSIKNIDLIKINKNASIPQYQTKGSLGMDLRACIKKKIYIKPNKNKLINTGIAIYIKNIHIAGLILPRSGLSHKKNIVLSNSVGLIDSDYQGEIMISLWNKNNNKNIVIHNKDRIAQIIFIPIFHIKFNIVNNFNHKTKRFKYGFGHTGIK